MHDKVVEEVQTDGSDAAAATDRSWLTALTPSRTTSGGHIRELSDAQIFQPAVGGR